MEKADKQFQFFAETQNLVSTTGIFVGFVSVFPSGTRVCAHVLWSMLVLVRVSLHCSEKKLNI